MFAGEAYVVLKSRQSALLVLRLSRLPQLQKPLTAVVSPVV